MGMLDHIFNPGFPGGLAWLRRRAIQHALYCPPSACAKEIQGDFRARKGFRDREIGIRGSCRASRSRFSTMNTPSAQTGPERIHCGERGMARRSS